MPLRNRIAAKCRWQVSSSLKWARNSGRDLKFRSRFMVLILVDDYPKFAESQARKTENLKFPLSKVVLTLTFEAVCRVWRAFGHSDSFRRFQPCLPMFD